MLGMRTAVIFDLDGVLVDSRAVFLNCVNYALDKLGVERPPEEQLLRYIGPPLTIGFPDLLQTTADDPRVLALVDGYRERYRTAMLTETTVPPGIAGALEQLNGHTLAVATSKPYEFAEPLLGAMGLREHFDAVAGPDLDARGETKTETLARALAAVQADRAVMVGDRSFDVVGAHANAIPCIGVTWGIGDAAELTDAGADALIDTPAELLQAATILLDA